MRDKNTYRVIVSVTITDMEFTKRYNFDSTTEVDVSELDSVSYLANNVATYLGRSAGTAAMRGEGLRVAPTDQAELLTD